LIAATQELTGKTLNASVAKGTWTASGTWTIPAVTLGGAVSGGDQSFTNVGDMAFAAGSILASGSTNGNTLLLKANDTTFITLTTGATDTMSLGAFTLSGTVTGGSQTVNSLGNLGLGADAISYTDLYVGGLGRVSFIKGTEFFFNSYYANGVGEKYLANGAAFGIWNDGDNSKLVFMTAAVGVAGNAVTAIHAFYLDVTGGTNFPTSIDLSSAADLVKIGGYEISAGHRALCIGCEEAVVAETDETKFSHKLPVRINGATYNLMLCAT
jgi:hypothetical protein